MMSKADTEKMMAQLEAIAAEIKSAGVQQEAVAARLKVLSADLSRIREKLL